MVRALLREHQIGDRDNLSEDEHDVLVHENLVTSGTLNFQDGTISGTGDVYATTLYGDGSNLTGLSSTPESLYYNGTDIKATATAAGIEITDGTATAATIGFSSDDLIIKNNDADGLIYIKGTRDVGTESLIMSCNPDSGIIFHYDGYNVLSLRTSGFTIADGPLGGSNSGDYYFVSSALHIKSNVDGGWVNIESDHLSDGSQSYMAKLDPDGAAELYYAGDIALKTQTEGITLYRPGTSDVTNFRVTTGGNLSIDHMVEDGTLTITSRKTGDTEATLITGDPNGAVKLNHAGTNQFETVVSGVGIPEDSFMYFGDTTTSGSWRMGISGEDFVHQKYNGSGWETKQTVVG